MDPITKISKNLAGVVEREIHEQSRLRLGFLNVEAWRAISQALENRQLIHQGRKIPRAPLLGHCLSNTYVRTASILPAIRPSGYSMDDLLAALDAVAGDKPRQILQPKAGGLHLSMPMLLRLDDLIRFPDGRADHADGVLDAPTRDGGVHQKTNEAQGLALAPVPNLLREMAAAAHSKMRAGRMGDHQVPLLIEDFLDWLLQMPPRIAFAFEQITRPSIVAALAESIAHAGAVFTGDENSHQKSNGSTGSAGAEKAEP